MLLRDGQTFLGLVVLVFSILLPVVKLLYLLLVSTLPASELRRHAKRLKAIEWIGKWSMHDVLVLALTIFFLKSQGVYDAREPAGRLSFHHRRGSHDPRPMRGSRPTWRRRRAT